QPLIDAVDHDHAAGAHLARDRARVDAEPARALHHHRLARLEAGDVEPGVDLRVGAVHARRHLVGDLGRQLEHRVVRAEIEVLAEAALEVWPLLTRHEPVRLTYRAGLEMPRETRFAAAAREEIAIGDAIAERQRLAGDVRLHSLAELGYRAAVFMAGVGREP